MSPCDTERKYVLSRGRTAKLTLIFAMHLCGANACGLSPGYGLECLDGSSAARPHHHRDTLIYSAQTHHLPCRTYGPRETFFGGRVVRPSTIRIPESSRVFRPPHALSWCHRISSSCWVLKKKWKKREKKREKEKEIAEVCRWTDVFGRKQRKCGEGKVRETHGQSIPRSLHFFLSFATRKKNLQKNRQMSGQREGEGKIEGETNG